ncbi:MAG: AAA-like domain-containing protein, partial [Microcoleaceae cyanobacterium]
DEDLYQALKRGEFCYVLNSRQMGKSSLRVRTMQRLQAEGVKCVAIDIPAIGTSDITPEEWYFGVIDSMVNSLELYDDFDLDTWWEDNNKLSIINRFRNFLVEGLLKYISEKIVIFVDEIDSILSLKFSLDDFFAVIRECYNQRVDNPEYERLTFTLIGVATPSDLISDKRRTPFNIGRAIELTGFTLTESQPLMMGLESITSHPNLLITEILQWTGGQPFLTQKLCNLIKNKPEIITNNQEIIWLDNLVNQKIIESWEMQDEPEHLRTIKNRILVNQQTASRLLGLYQQVLKGNFQLEGNPEENILRLTGLVVKRESTLQVYNQIYAAIFNQNWLNQELAKLRPYSENFNAWVESNYQDESRLLRGQALIDALTWAENKNLSTQDHRYLEASQKLEQKATQLELVAQKQANQILAEAKQQADLALAEANQQLTQVKKQTEKIIRKGRIVTIRTGIIVGIIVVSSFLFIKDKFTILDLANVRLTAASAKETFAEQPLESLIESLRSAQQLKKINQSNWDQDNTKTQVISTLHHAIYTVINYYTLSDNSNWFSEVSFSPDGEMIASASDDNTVKLWKRDGTLVKTLSDHSSSVLGVSFSPDGEMIVSASADKTVKLWKQDGTLLKTLSGHTDRVNGVSFSPDGEMIASASADNTVKLWKRDGILAKTLSAHGSSVLGVSFSPDGEIIASAGADKTVKLWKRDGTLLKTLSGHTNYVNRVSFSPDGEIIASAGADNTVKLWKRDGILAKTLSAHGSSVLGVSFSPDGEMIASAGADKTVKLWKRDGTLLKTFSGHTSYVNGVSFSPDGEMIASAGADKTVKLWKRYGTLLKTFFGHSSSVKEVNFSPDGEMIASASNDKTVKLWKKDGTLLQTLSRHRDKVGGVSFSPDGKTLASASEDQTVILWDLTIDIDQLIALGCHWLNDYFITHPEVKQELPVCQDKTVLKSTPSLIFTQAQELAKFGNIHQSLALFIEAKKLDSRLEFNPEKDIYQPASLYWVNQAKRYVDQGDFKFSSFLFNKSLKIYPKLKINIESEITLADAIAALNQGNIETASNNFKKALDLDNNLDISAEQWGKLCSKGSLNGYAKKVLFACENAVKLSPYDASLTDNRGLARALTGDFSGAIEDFKAFVEWTNNDEKKAQRKEWIKMLKLGKNPFTPEVLEGLLHQKY